MMMANDLSKTNAREKEYSWMNLKDSGVDLERSDQKIDYIF